MNEPLFYVGGGFEVTDQLLRTPRRTYALDKIEYVSVTRPLLVFLGGPALGVVGIAISFRRYLFAGEIITMMIVSATALILCCLFATLRVHSLALRAEDDTQTFGPLWRLRQVRVAVERAMVFRKQVKQQS